MTKRLGQYLLDSGDAGRVGRESYGDVARTLFWG